ncbi:hypothetical protein P7C71_g2686, partial [Lecanoromycetidae sp. Uapishka_2]
MDRGRDRRFDDNDRNGEQSESLRLPEIGMRGARILFQEIHDQGILKRTIIAPPHGRPPHDALNRSHALPHPSPHAALHLMYTPTELRTQAPVHIRLPTAALVHQLETQSTTSGHLHEGSKHHLELHRHVDQWPTAHAPHLHNVTTTATVTEILVLRQAAPPTEALTLGNPQLSCHQPWLRYLCQHTIVPQVLPLSLPLHDLVVARALVVEVIMVDEAIMLEGAIRETVHMVAYIRIVVVAPRQHRHTMGPHVNRPSAAYDAPAYRVPPPFRSNNSSSTTYPRTQRFSTNHLASIPAIKEGGEALPSLVDPATRKRLAELEEGKKKLMEQIEEKQREKRKQLREWNSMERESRRESLKSDLAETALEAMSGEGAGTTGTAF